MALASQTNAGGRKLKQSTAHNRAFFMGVTGLTLTITLSKDGGAFAASGGTVTELTVGWYKIALTTTDTNTIGDLAYHVTDGGTNIIDFADEVCLAGNDANLVQIDGLATNGNNATLNLKQLNVVNTAGHGIVATAGGAGNHGILASGNGVGSGIQANGGANSGTGIAGAAGAPNGAGFYGQGAGNGPGAIWQGGATGGDGQQCIGGTSTGRGMSITCTSGTALDISSPTGGQGIQVVASGASAVGFRIRGGGSGAGIDAKGGATGAGFLLAGGATSGAGFSISATSGDGILLSPGGAGVGINGQLSATSLNLVLVGGFTLPRALDYIGASVAGPISGAGSSTEVFKSIDGLTTRLTITVDGSGNRTGIVYG